MNGLKSALSLMTIYPVRFRDSEQFSYQESVGWLGWTGLLLALPVFFAAMLLQGSLSATSLGLIVLALFAILTRMMHWDGLCDVSDAWWGGDTPLRRQEIMSDSNTGAFALITVVIVGLGMFLALSHIVASHHFLLIVAIPILARVGATYSIIHIPPAKTEGLGAAVTAHAKTSGNIATLTALMAALGCCLITGGVILIAAGALVLGFGFLLSKIIARRMGGLTGDVLGASLVLTELFGFCVCLLLL